MKLRLPTILMAFVLSMMSARSADLTWAPTSGTSWGTTITGNWVQTGSSTVADFASGDTVTFGDLTTSGPQTVTVEGSVDPGSVTFNSTQDYTVSSGTSGVIAGSGILTQAGTGTTTLSLANTYTGGTVLTNGTLVVNASNALGSGAITLTLGTLNLGVTGSDVLASTNTLTFGGGTFTYGVDSGQDISGLITTNAGQTVIVDTQTFSETWTTRGLSTIGMALTKLGSGTLTVNAGGSLTTGLTCNEGTLVVNVPKGSTLSGSLSGSGTINLITTGGMNTRVNVTGTNTNFTGNLILTGTPNSNTTQNDISFESVDAIGVGTLTLNGRGMWVNQRTTPNVISANLVVDASGGWFNGFVDSVYTWNGSLSGSGNLATTTQSPTAMVINFYGDLTGFTGTMSPNGCDFNFGNGETATLDSSGNVINATTLSGVSSSRFSNYTVNYSNDVNLPFGVGNNANLIISGTGTATYTGTQTGTGVLNIQTGASAALGSAGNANGIWAGNVQVDGTLTYNTTGDRTITLLGGSGTLNYAAGTGNSLALQNANTSVFSGIFQVSGGGTLNMGSLSYGGQTTITNGNLQNASNYSGGVFVNLGTGVTTTSVGGVSGSQIRSITTTEEGATVTDINGDMSFSGAGDLSLVVNTTNIGIDPDTPAETLLQFVSTDSTMTVANKGTLSLDMTTDTVITILQSNNDTLRVGVTNGSLSVDYINNVSITPILFQYGYLLTGVDGGDLLLSGGQTSWVYMVTSDAATTDPHTITSYSALDYYTGVLVGSGQTLTLQLNGAPGSGESALVIPNLSGTSAGGLTLVNTGTGLAEITFNNTADTVYNGAVTASAGSVTKTGANALTIGLNYTANTTTLSEGALILQGNSNSLTTATMAGGTLDLVGETTTIGTLASTGTTQSTLTVEEGATLNLGNTSTPTTSTVTYTTIAGAGTVNILPASSLSLGTSSQLTGTVINLGSGSSLTIDTGANAAQTISGLTGTGVLNNAAGATLTDNVAEGESYSYSGSISGTGSLVKTGAGTQTLVGAGNSTLGLQVSEGTLALQGGTSGLMEYASASVASGATLDVSVPSTGATNPQVNLGSGSFTLSSGSNFAVTWDTDDANTPAVVTTTGAIVVGDNVSVTVASIDPEASSSSEEPLSVTLFEGTTAQLGTGTTATGTGVFSVYYENLALEEQGGNTIVLTGERRVDNIFNPARLTHNSSQSGDALWNGRNSISSSTPLSSLMGSVADQIAANNNATASQYLSAASGSSITALSAIQRDGMRQEMEEIRNRTVYMGLPHGYKYSDTPYYQMWANGSGGYTELKSDWDESGYRMSSWGATIGMNIEMNPCWTVGCAFSANFGDFDANSVEVADGRMDAYYLTFFGVYRPSEWTHRFLVTGGLNNAKIDRTVNYGTGSYSTHGDSDGEGYGLLYEVNYNYYLDDDKLNVLQPLASIGVMGGRMSGFSETGAGEAGLHVDDMDYTTATLKAGARWIHKMVQATWFKVPVLELRANVAQDMGDDRPSMTCSYLGLPNQGMNIRGCKAGTTALQIGMGLSCPFENDSALFLDVNADFRSRQNGVAGYLGYRWTF